MTTQYIQVDLGSANGRLYTYLNTQPADVAIGDTVEITLPSGDTRLVEVKGVSLEPPPNVPSSVRFKPCYKAG